MNSRDFRTLSSSLKYWDSCDLDGNTNRGAGPGGPVKSGNAVIGRYALVILLHLENFPCCHLLLGKTSALSGTYTSAAWQAPSTHVVTALLYAVDLRNPKSAKVRFTSSNDTHAQIHAKSVCEAHPEIGKLSTKHGRCINSRQPSPSKHQRRRKASSIQHSQGGGRGPGQRRSWQRGR